MDEIYNPMNMRLCDTEFPSESLLHDFSDLIGKPYLDGGLGPDSFDCFGLVRWVWHKALGICLPEKHLGWRRFGDVLPWPCEIRLYDILMFESLNIVDHVGVMVSETEFLHTGRIYGGVVCEPVWRAKDKIRAVGRKT